MFENYEGDPSDHRREPVKKKSHVVAWVIATMVIVLGVCMLGVAFVVAPTPVTPKPPAVVGPAASAAVPAAADPVPTHVKMGDIVTVTYSDGASYSVVLTSPKITGKYVAVLVEITGLKGTVAYNPLYFGLRNVDGTEATAMSGMFADVDPTLKSGDLSAGQKAKGWVAFEVPDPQTSFRSASIEMSGPLFDTLAIFALTS